MEVDANTIATTAKANGHQPVVEGVIPLTNAGEMQAARMGYIKRNESD